MSALFLRRRKRKKKNGKGASFWPLAKVLSGRRPEIRVFCTLNDPSDLHSRLILFEARRRGFRGIRKRERKNSKVRGISGTRRQEVKWIFWNNLVVLVEKNSLQRPLWFQIWLLSFTFLSPPSETLWSFNSRAFRKNMDVDFSKFPALFSNLVSKTETDFILRQTPRESVLLTRVSSQPIKQRASEVTFPRFHCSWSSSNERDLSRNFLLGLKFQI